MLYVFIESKNSPLFLVLRSLSSRKSMASMVPIGLRMRRARHFAPVLRVASYLSGKF
jgi:hypothetical protein